VESTWKDGIHVEMGWNLCGMVESTRNPPYSMWNIGGRKSPKWVRSQPKHIPCGIRGLVKDLDYSLNRLYVVFILDIILEYCDPEYNL